MRRPHVDLRLGAIVTLVAALAALGSWVLVDRYTGGGSATQNATTLLDSFYGAMSANDTATATALLTSDAVVWSNGIRIGGPDGVASHIAGAPGLHVERIARVASWGNFATTFIWFSAPMAGINKVPMVEIAQFKDGKIVRLWDFAPGLTPPLTNALMP